MQLFHPFGKYYCTLIEFKFITKILITGATGFVGSHILETLLNIKHPDIEIVAACRDPSKLITQFYGEVRQGDLRDANYLDRVLIGIDIICHTAGWSSFEKSGNNNTHAYLEPTLDLINHAIEWRVSRFINLSSIYAGSIKNRNNADKPGLPRAYWPMINCLIAVENYLRDFQQYHCQFINLRLGIYAGDRLNMGLLPLLLNRANQILQPYFTGTSGHFPLIDGRDIGQAFIRAALCPIDTMYSCFNIVGPDIPTHKEMLDFIKRQSASSALSFGLPPALAKALLAAQGLLHMQNRQVLFTRAMLNMLESPVIDNTPAHNILGYDPEISWQASLLNTLKNHKNKKLNNDLTQPIQALNLE